MSGESRRMIPSPSRLRFSLRFWLMMTILAGTSLGLLGIEWNRSRQLAEHQRERGEIRASFDKLGLFAHLNDDNNVIQLSPLRGPDTVSMGPDDYELLRPLNNLQVLNLGVCGIPEDQLHNIAGHLSLRELNLQNSPLSDNGLAELSELKNLEFLRVSWSNIHDAGLEHLIKLPRLKKLDLAGTSITDAGLDHLAKMTQLEWVDLSKTNVTEDGVAHLFAALPECNIFHSTRYRRAD